MCVCVLIDLPTIQGGVMWVIKEMPPDLDNKREITEVQVREEGEVFDVDAFLASIPKPGMTQPQCPRCLVDMTFGSIQHEDGSQFQYYRFFFYQCLCANEKKFFSETLYNTASGCFLCRPRFYVLTLELCEVLCLLAKENNL